MIKKIGLGLAGYFALLSVLSAQNEKNTTMISKSDKMQQVLTKTTDGKKVFGTTFIVKYNNETWQGASGNLEVQQPFFIASTTKLFVTALIYKFLDEGKLTLDDKITKYLDSSITNRLHVYKGTDYSNTITIKHLLAHTSGIPDYFQNKGASGKSLEDELVIGNDQYWTFEQAINRSKAMKPLFIPGAKNKAHYSDANFQLLGKIIENISGKLFYDNCMEHIINPLHLTNTYLYANASDTKPKTLYYKQSELIIPKAMTSFGPDGGMVSTTEDMLVFTEAFFTGRLFPVQYIKEMQVWNNIFTPMQSGVGIHLFKLPWLFNPTGAIPEIIGHSGLSGALAYYSPKHNLYIAGTVNQVAYPQISFKVAIKLMQIALSR